MIKRGPGPGFLPDPSGFNDWKTWARQFKTSLEQQKVADEARLPFFEFATVKRDPGVYFPSLASATFEWESFVDDFTTGANPSVWDAGDNTKLFVPTRPGDIQYGYAMVVGQIEVSQSSGSNATGTLRIDTNGVAYEDRSPGHTHRIFSGSLKYILQVTQVWKPVVPGDYFQLKWDSNVAGLMNVRPDEFTYFHILLAGPARGV